jgi:hypothetical protein
MSNKEKKLLAEFNEYATGQINKYLTKNNVTLDSLVTKRGKAEKDYVFNSNGKNIFIIDRKEKILTKYFP